MKVLNQVELIEFLNEKGFKVVDGDLFAPQYKGSVWFHYPDDEKAASLQATELSWDGVNQNKFPITDMVKEHGWYIESYDSETLFAYKSTEWLQNLFYYLKYKNTKN